MMSRSIGEHLKKVFIFFSNYLPLQIWTLKIYDHFISKTITARSFKLGQLIEDDDRSIGENLKKSYFIFSNNLPWQMWTFKYSLNSLPLQFCRYDVTALPTPVLNLATFIYKHLLGA